MNYDSKLQKWHEFFCNIKTTHSGSQFWQDVNNEINNVLIPYFYNWTLGTLQIPEPNVQTKPYIIKDLTHSSITIINSSKYHDGFTYTNPTTNQTITKTGLPGGFLTSNFTLTFENYDFKNDMEKASENYAFFVFWDMFGTKVRFDAQYLFTFLINMPLLRRIDTITVNDLLSQPKKFVNLLAEAGESPNTVIDVINYKEDQEPDVNE